MPTFGIIDDREDLRITLKRSLEVHLTKGWGSIDICPFIRLEDYPSWIGENEVSVMLLDERLDEQIATTTENISYKGHDLVDFIRERFPTLPIYVITTYPNTEGLDERFRDVEEIIIRQDFSRNAEKYVPRMLRAGQKFLDTYQAELTELSDKAVKMAKGTASTADIERAKAIRSKIGYAFPSETFSKHSVLLKALENNLTEIEKLKKEVEKFLKENN